LNQYTKRRAQKVGNLKAGWIPTARLNSKTRIPAWIGNQQKSGSVRNNMNPKTGGGSIKFSNNVNHASRWKRTNDFILRQNGKRMVRALKAEYRKSIKQANAGTK